MTTQWTRSGVLGLILKQLPFLERHKRDITWADQKGIWFGAWEKPQGHWVRQQVESLHLIAALIAGVRAGELEGDKPDVAPLIADIEAGVLAACACHCSDGSLQMPNTKGPWGKGWQSAWWAHRLVRTSLLMSDVLSAGAKAGIRRVAEVECDRFLGVTPPTGIVYDTKAEENAWDAPVLAWSSFAYPDHPHAVAWEKAARLWALNAHTVAADRFDRRPWDDGKPFSAFVAGACLHPDFSCENHGTFHPNYQACVMINCVTASAYHVHNKPVPPALLHNVKQATEVLAYFLAADSTQLMITGNDWHTYHGHHSCIPLLAHFLNDERLVPLAHANLSRYQNMLEQSDTGHIFGSTMRSNIGEQAFFFHTGNSTLLVDVLPVMPLKLQPPKAKAVGVGGRRHWNYVEVVTQRDDNRLAAMSWRTLYNHPIATVLPVHGPGVNFASWAPFTGIGRFVLKNNDKLTARVIHHHETTTANGYATAGLIEWRDSAGTALIHQHIEMQASAGEAVLLKETSTALAHLELAINDQWTMSLVNDLHNGKARKVKDQRGKVHTVKALTGKESTVWGGFQIIVDDIIRYEADRELTYVAPGKRLAEDNRFESSQFDRVLVRSGIGAFEAGDTVRSGVLRIEV
jgi:hypothetical protein